MFSAGRRGRQKKEVQKIEGGRGGQEGGGKKRGSYTLARGGRTAGTSQSRYKKRYMINIYLTDSDWEANVDTLGRTNRSCTRLMNISWTKQGRGVSGRDLPTVSTCLSRCARPGLSHKGHVTAS